MSRDSVQSLIPLLVDQERLGSDGGEEGPQPPGEVKGVHVWPGVAPLPDTENEDVDSIVQGPSAQAGEEGAGVEGDQRGAVGEC